MFEFIAFISCEMISEPVSAQGLGLIDIQLFILSFCGALICRAQPLSLVFSIVVNIKKFPNSALCVGVKGIRLVFSAFGN
jgi:hypothetical protein